jgi:hypothetical protein
MDEAIHSKNEVKVDLRGSHTDNRESQVMREIQSKHGIFKENVMTRKKNLITIGKSSKSGRWVKQVVSDSRDTVGIW